MTNNKVYIHEFIDIIGHNRANYMHHITANWSPIGQKQRNQLCYGVWGIVGTTRGWPEVLNLWEEDGFDGLASSFRHEFGHPTLQDPELSDWWARAAQFRRHGNPPSSFGQFECIARRINPSRRKSSRCREPTQVRATGDAHL